MRLFLFGYASQSALLGNLNWTVFLFCSGDLVRLLSLGAVGTYRYLFKSNYDSGCCAITISTDLDLLCRS